MKCIIATTQKHFYDQILIRTAVFVVEQSVPAEEEFDAIDKTAVQFIVYDNDEAIGTARLRLIDAHKGKIERVCVLKSARHRGVGRKLIETIENYVKDKTTVHSLMLGAQLTAIPFYERLGYKAYGDCYLDANIEHRLMDKSL